MAKLAKDLAIFLYSFISEYTVFRSYQWFKGLTRFQCCSEALYSWRIIRFLIFENHCFMKKYIEVGKVLSTRGVSGEIKVQTWCNKPSDFLKFKELFLDDISSKKVALARVKILSKSIVLLKLKDVNSLEKAKTLVNKTLYVDRNDIKLKKDEHLLVDLIGLRAISENKEQTYGIITDVITGNMKTNLYEITLENGKRCLIPDVKEIVTKIDLQNKTVAVNPIDGLFDNYY